MTAPRRRTRAPPFGRRRRRRVPVDRRRDVRRRHAVRGPPPAPRFSARAFDGSNGCLVGLDPWSCRSRSRALRTAPSFVGPMHCAASSAGARIRARVSWRTQGPSTGLAACVRGGATRSFTRLARSPSLVLGHRATSLSSACRSRCRRRRKTAVGGGGCDGGVGASGGGDGQMLVDRAISLAGAAIVYICRSPASPRAGIGEFAVRVRDCSKTCTTSVIIEASPRATPPESQCAVQFTERRLARGTLI